MKFLSNKKVLLMSTLVLLTSQAHALPAYLCTGPQKLFDFSAYTLGSMEVQNSDFEGSVGAQGNLSAFKFHFAPGQNSCISVSSTGLLSVNSSAIDKDAETFTHATIQASSVGGILTAPSVELRNMSIQGDLVLDKNSEGANVLPSNVGLDGISYAHPLIFRVNHSQIGEELLDMSARLSLLPATVQAEKEAETITIKAQGAETVVQLSANELKAAKNIQIFADPSQKIVINVTGERVAINGIFIRLLGGLQAEQIVWNISEANSLEIGHTKNPSYGLPGRVLAPHADTYFHEGLIVGGLYVKSMHLDMQNKFNAPTGQINRPGHYNDAGQPYN